MNPPTDETYNGWTNRETWAVALWVDNDEGLYNARRCVGHDAADLQQWIEHELLNFQWWEQEMFGPMPEPICNMKDDIGSLWRVDWQALSEHWEQDD